MLMTVKEIIENWSIAQKAGAVLPCPRCGHTRMEENLYRNSLSRRADIYMCQSCGTDESIVDFKGVSDGTDSWWVSETVLKKQKINGIENGYFNIKTTKDVVLTRSDIDDIMVGALEGGITYWCDKAEVVQDEYYGEYASEQISRGGSLRLHDCEDDVWHELDLEKFLNGFALACNNGYADDWYLEDGIDCCMIDAIAADIIVQYSLFGEVLYG